MYKRTGWSCNAEKSLLQPKSELADRQDSRAVTFGRTVALGGEAGAADILSGVFTIVVLYLLSSGIAPGAGSGGCWKSGF